MATDGSRSNSLHSTIYISTALVLHCRKIHHFIMRLPNFLLAFTLVTAASATGKGKRTLCWLTNLQHRD